MKIAVKLHASLMPYMPETDQRHAFDIEIDPSDTPYQVVDSLNIPRELAHLVIVNGLCAEMIAI
jgi:molybdopterin synthase sulfur carrier subunit